MIDLRAEGGTKSRSPLEEKGALFVIITKVEIQVVAIGIASIDRYV